MKFPQQNINQSETRIGDKKLSLELYVKHITHHGSHASRVTIIRSPKKYLPLCPRNQVRSWSQWSSIRKNFCQFISEILTGRGREKTIGEKGNCKAFCVTRKRNKLFMTGLSR